MGIKNNGFRKKGINIKRIVKYLFRVLSLLLASSIIAFILVSLSPIDPVQQYVLGSGGVSAEQQENIAQYWGVKDPPVKRYMNWLSAIVHGDMGNSLLYRQPVAQVIGEKFSNTLALMLTAWLVSGITGFILGCVMGMNKGRLADRVIKRVCLVITTLPAFWVGLIFLMVFSVALGWFPIGLSAPVGVVNSEVSIMQKLHHLILPAMAVSFISFPPIALHTRQKLAEVLASDYVLFAKARGENRFSILKRHGIRNILLPAVTLQFSSFAELFTGSVLAENVFSYPGLGSAASAAGLNSDVPLLLGITLVSILFVSAGNLLSEIIYGAVDPQLREGRHD